MDAKESVDWLEPTKWQETPADIKIDLLRQIRSNLSDYSNELAQSDCEMKNNLIGGELYHPKVGLVATVVPVASTISACIDLYESLMHGKLPEPISIEKVGDDLFDIYVFPHSAKDKVMYAGRKDYLRVKGKPKQVNPLDKPGGIIAVLGAGNYSSSLEMIKALFLENCVVVHRPHHLNEKTDKIWAKIMQPLVGFKALSFCDSKGGRELIKDPRLKKIYFTGSSSVAQKIMETTDTEFISECGGNNPCIVVPGDKPWNHRQIHHQAMQIATIAKMNGGAVCGRTQTIVTSKNWPQRDEFLEELKKALENETPAEGSYYPGSEDVVAAFKENHPEAQTIKPEEGKHPKSDFLFIEGVDEDSYAVKNEAFCQIIDEVALDVPAEADIFLEKAVEFCNTKLLGTLGSAILIDDHMMHKHQDVLKKAVTDMEYGGIGVNIMPPMIFLNPYLTWGGNEEGKEFVSGVGNFGNALCFENVEKSIIYSDFMNAGHMINANKSAFHGLCESMAKYAVDPSWMHLTGMMAGALAGKLKHKDF